MNRPSANYPLERKDVVNNTPTAQNNLGSRLSGALNRLSAQLARLVRAGNRRQLVLRNAADVTLLRTPVTLAVVVGLLLLWWAAPLLLAAFILALVFRVRFIISSEVEGGAGP